jgi:hypothetical protein
MALTLHLHKRFYMHHRRLAKTSALTEAAEALKP